MDVGRDTVVAIDLDLADFQGNLIQRSERAIHYLHGGYGDILPALERALEGKRSGARITVRLEPEEAFGDYDETLLRVESRAGFPDELEVGMRLEGMPGDAGDDTIYTVTDIAADKVVLDGNHPLAGIGLEFRCTVRAVRAATGEEVARGAADDPDGLALRVG
ncbi:MAG TPA: peptidylprolyl isomerase [Burkholderiales bacterium]|nr:peptidylprolyl isomerase [Burkholderiales bacterium]